MATPRICSVPGCGKINYSRQMCRPHYSKAMLGLIPLPDRVKPTKNTINDFVNRAAACEDEACLIWPWARNQKTGYGILPSLSFSPVVSRHVCFVRHGPPPSLDHETAHRCGKGHEGCVNGAHLRWATKSENQLDRIAHDTHTRGTRNSNAVLNEDAVHDIRAQLKSGVPEVALAAKYGVVKETIYAVRDGKTWAWLK